MTIDYWRSEIDEIDKELLRLLNRRARLAMRVGALKQEAGVPCCDPEREHEVLTRLQQSNSGPLNSSAVSKVFRRIITESRRIEAQSILLQKGGKNDRAYSYRVVSKEYSTGEGVLV
jgi:chorismate mutase-like protein